MLKTIQQLHNVLLPRVISRSKGQFLEQFSLLGGMESFCNEDLDSYVAGEAGSGQDYMIPELIIGIIGVSLLIIGKPNGSIASPA